MCTTLVLINLRNCKIALFNADQTEGLTNLLKSFLQYPLFHRVRLH